MRRFRCRRAVRHVPAARPFKLPTFIGVLSRVAGSRHDLFCPSACPGLYIGGMTTIDEIVENFTLLDQWDDRYRYVIELGRTLAPLPESAHSEANKVRGCASQVWLLSHVKPDGAAGPTLTFDGDSDAHIVRGLIAILLALYPARKRVRSWKSTRSSCSTASACARISRRNDRTACARWLSASAPKPRRRWRRLPEQFCHSGTRVKRADPESILRRTGVMDSGLAALGRAPE